MMPFAGSRAVLYPECYLQLKPETEMTAHGKFLKNVDSTRFVSFFSILRILCTPSEVNLLVRHCAVKLFGEILKQLDLYGVDH